MNWGAFAGGAAQGISRGIADADLMKEMKRRDKLEGREDEEYAREQAYRGELAGLDAVDRPEGNMVMQPEAPAAPIRNEAGEGIGVMAGGQRPDTSAPLNPAMGGIAGQMSPSAPAQPKQAAPPDALHGALNKSLKTLAIMRKYGKIDDPTAEIKLMQIGKGLEKEGVRDTYMLADQGDMDRALKNFNSTGDMQGAKWGTVPTQQEITLPNGVKTPSMVGTIILPSGKEVPFNSKMGLWGMFDYEKQLSAMMQGKTLQAEEKYRADNLGLQREQLTANTANDKATQGIQAGTLKVHQDTLSETIRDNKEKNGIAATRAQAIGSGVGRGGLKVVTDIDGNTFYMPNDGSMVETGKMNDRQQAIINDLSSRRAELIKAKSAAVDVNGEPTPQQGEYQKQIDTINTQIDGILRPEAAAGAGGDNNDPLAGAISRISQARTNATTPPKTAGAGISTAAPPPVSPAQPPPAQPPQATKQGIIKGKAAAAAAHEKYALRGLAEKKNRQIDEQMSAMKTPTQFAEKFKELFGAEALMNARPEEVKRKVLFYMASQKTKI